MKATGPGRAAFFTAIFADGHAMTFTAASPEVYEKASEAMATGNTVGISFKQKKDEPADQHIQGLDA